MSSNAIPFLSTLSGNRVKQPTQGETIRLQIEHRLQDISQMMRVRRLQPQPVPDKFVNNRQFRPYFTDREFRFLRKQAQVHQQPVPPVDMRRHRSAAFFPDQRRAFLQGQIRRPDQQSVLDGAEHISKVAFITTLAGYVHFMLTGENVVGVGEGSGIFPLDYATLDYDAALLQKFDALLEQFGIRRPSWFLSVIWT